MMNSKKCLFFVALLSSLAWGFYHQVAAADGSIVINGRPGSRTGARMASASAADATVSSSQTLVSSSPSAAMQDQIVRALAEVFGDKAVDVDFEVDVDEELVFFLSPIDGQLDALSFQEVMAISRN